MRRPHAVPALVPALVLSLFHAHPAAAQSDPAPANAASAEVVRAIMLEGPDAPPLRVGTLRLSAPDGTGARRYAVAWEESLFEDHFLSMRPFRCLGGGAQLWCRVPYPYEIRRQLRPGDATDLEYDLLFVWKTAGSYGIDLWNGVYFVLDEAGAAHGGADGAGPWTGLQHDYDMNALGVPPPAGELRPIAPDALTEGPGEGRRFTALRIE